MVEAVRNVCLKFNLLAARCESVKKRGRSMSGNGTFLIRAQPRSSDAETLPIDKEMKTRRERQSAGEQKDGEGGGVHREIQYAPVPPLVQPLHSQP